MIYQTYTPQLPISQFVDSFIYLENNNKGTGLPKSAMSIVFNLEDFFKCYTDQTFKHFVEYKRFWIAGLQTQPTYVENKGLSKMLVVQFKPLGAFAFMQEPMHAFTNQYIGLDDVFKQKANDTWEKIMEAISIPEKFQVVETFLIKHLLPKIPSTHHLNILSELYCYTKPTAIQEICKRHAISRKHLHYLSKEYIGLSSKNVQSIHRFQWALKNLAKVTTISLTETAYHSKYYDQAHFNHDFKKFTLLKPTEYVKLLNQHKSMTLIPHFIPHIPSL